MTKIIINPSNWDEKTKESFVQTCFEGFGMMNKNNYEVAMFYPFTK